jgi:thymidine phosphorylase
MVAAQGGDLDSLPQPRNSRHVVASRGGVVAAIEPRAVGLAVAAMAEQRNPRHRHHDLQAGVTFAKAPGDTVETGEPIAVVTASDPAWASYGATAIEAAVTIADQQPSHSDHPPITVTSGSS